jgi:hypothetical protein
MKTSEQPSVDVQARLDRLEASLWRTRFTLAAVVLAALLALAGGSLLATASSDTITARAFHLTDGQGRVRAALIVVPGGAALTLHDEQGKGRALLGVIPTGSADTLRDAQGKPRALLSAFRVEETLALWNAFGSSTFSAP